MEGKHFLEKWPDASEHTNWAKKISRNHHISHCFRGNCIFAFYAEVQRVTKIQHDHQKVAGKRFFGKVYL